MQCAKNKLTLAPTPHVEETIKHKTHPIVIKKNLLIAALKSRVKKAKYMAKRKQLKEELNYYLNDYTPEETVDDLLRPFHQLTPEQQATVTKIYLAEKSELRQAFVKAVLLKQHRSNDIFLSAQKSMTLQTYLHSAMKRTETIVLLDSGATENFMSLDYAKYLQFPIQRLREPWKLFNVDGTPNKAGDLEFYMDLVTCTRTQIKTLCYFLSDLGENKVILGYLWFAATQPKIDWAKGWIAHDQLPIILRATDAMKARFLPGQSMARTGIVTPRKVIEPWRSDIIPTQYHDYRDVFEQCKGKGLPPLCPWDHMIELKPGAPATLVGRTIRLSQMEQVELTKFLKEHTARGTIRPSKSPYATPFFFIKKKNRKLQPVQDYHPVNS